MRTYNATIQIPAEVLAEAIAAIVPVDRHKAMVEKYGEACSKATAAKIIECSAPSITRMLEDGRLLTACEGTRVDVRSLADYIDRRGEKDHEARMLRKAARRGY